MNTTQKKKQKPKYSMWQSIAFMLRTAWKNDPSLLSLCAIMAAADVGTHMLQLFVAPQILSKVEQAAPVGHLLGTIAGFCGMLFLLMAARVYAERSSIAVLVGTRIAVMGKVCYKTCSMSYPNVHDPAAKKLLEGAVYATSGNREAAENVWRTLIALSTNIACFGLYLLVLSGLDFYLVAVVILTSVVGFFVNKRINEWEYRHRDEKNQYLERMSYIRRKSESIELGKDIRIFGLRPWLEEIYEDALRLWDAFITRRERTLIWANIIDLVLDLARNGIAYLYLIGLALDQGLAASEFLLYFSAISGFTNWVTGILKEFSTLHKECVDIGQIQEYLDYPELFRFSGGDPIPTSETWELRLDHVSFRYPGSEKKLFDDLNLCIRPGEKLAVVGLNGAGKSTLVKLLCGFYDPDEGRVLLNGKDIRSFNRQEYYDLFSAVFQEFSVLDTTLKGNVAQRLEGIDEERVRLCLEKAGLTELVEQLPAGLETHIGRDVYLDGVLLSGGQTQRLMLARALYKDGPLLVLDEPTAALDPIAENDIYMKYNEMTAGKTSLFISHRLASTRFCDRIIFVADGRIAEEGTHEQLLAKNGAYAELFEVQSRYYQEGREFRDEAR